MKKLIFLFALSLSFVAVKAQFAAPGFDYSGKISGPVTHTNAQADTIPFTIPGSRSIVAFHYAITKTSGTVAGTIVLQYHLTNVVGEPWITYNTYNLTDATADTVINIQYNPGLYYRLITTTTGTSVTVHNKYLLYRK